MAPRRAQRTQPVQPEPVDNANPVSSVDNNNPEPTNTGDPHPQQTSTEGGLLVPLQTRMYMDFFYHSTRPNVSA